MPSVRPRTLAVTSLANLTLALFAVAGAFAFSGVGAESPAFDQSQILRSDGMDGGGDFVGSDLGLDLYAKVDKGIGGLKKKLVEKRIKGNAAKLNKAIGKECGSVSGEDIIPCLDEGKDFTITELEEIEAGGQDALFSHLDSNVALTADQVPKIMAKASAFAKTLRDEAGSQAQQMSTVGSIGLYADGSVENSSHDLMFDLKNIHEIIFAKDVPYTGIPNDSNMKVAFFANSPSWPILGDSDDSDYPHDDEDHSPLGDPAGIDYVVPPDTGDAADGGGDKLSSDMFCKTGEKIAGLDGALAADINNQAKYGKNSGTAGAAADLNNARNGTGPDGKPMTVKQRLAIAASEAAESLLDKFKCSTFFCIDVEFIMYDTMLLGGGKNYSIETILDRALKISHEFAGSSFVQAEMTKNFFGPIWKNLNLPNLVQLPVIVQTLPPPILNLKGEDTPAGKPATSSEDKEFKEISRGVFKDYGLDYDSPNKLDNPAVAHMVRNLEGLSTDAAAAGRAGKTEGAKQPAKIYQQMKSNSLRTQASDSFSNDLQEFRGFTQTFVDNAMNVATLADKYYKIPVGH